MMKLCEFCQHWAQWREWVVAPREDKPEFTIIYDESNTPVKKQLAKRGPTLLPGPVLCAFHKAEREQQRSEFERRYVFAGSIPA